MSPQLFSRDGGYKAAPQAGFVAGFTQAYTNPQTDEEIVITVIEFSAPAQAVAYYHAVGGKLLSAADPTYHPMQQPSGATEASGTKEYAGNFVHGASDATGRFYLQVVYQDPFTRDVPTEFPLLVQSEWTLLQPGVKLPPEYTSTTG